jgi:methylenetetrahydrofolate reductase (NADPH)|tara:strand:- start:1869 stop:2735 length:867 start_codon:yes stop_codon:yes gene_type:complete
MPVPNVSFEVFPPKSIDASFRLWDTAQVLAPLGPRFFSVTYGAGGSDQHLTHDAAQTLNRTSGHRVAAHLTCVGASKSDVLDTVNKFADAGITDIVALRGDPANGDLDFRPHENGFKDSCALIEALAKTNRFNIRVGAYPDVHPDAASAKQNIDWLKAKIDAGACEALTQFFFEAETFLRFRDACADAGITAPITPGILPISNWNSARKFAEKCGTFIPTELAQTFEKAARDGRTDLLSVAQCTELCDDLMCEGVSDLHFYTLNRPDLTRDVCHALGVTQASSIRNVA